MMRKDERVMPNDIKDEKFRRHVYMKSHGPNLWLHHWHMDEIKRLQAEVDKWRDMALERGDKCIEWGGKIDGMSKERMELIKLRDTCDALREHSRFDAKMIEQLSSDYEELEEVARAAANACPGEARFNAIMALRGYFCRKMVERDKAAG